MLKLAMLIAPLALLAAPLAANAQQPQPQPPPQHMKAPSKAKSVSSATLHKFADAYQDSMKVRTKYAAKMQNAKNKKQKQSVQKDAERDMKSAIQKHMTVKQYMKVAKVVNANPKLQQRLIKILQAKQKPAGPPTRGA
jgi:transposase-like protein